MVTIAVSSTSNNHSYHETYNMASTFARFPLPFKVGTDICRITRVKHILDGPRSEKFIKRILTEEERVLASDLLQPFLGEESVPESIDSDKKPEKPGNVGKVPRFIASRYVPFLTNRLRTPFSHVAQLCGKRSCYQSQ